MAPRRIPRTLLAPALLTTLLLPAAGQGAAAPTDLSVGRRHPDFHLPRVDGSGSGRLSDHLGAGRKVVVFNFASW